MTENEAIDEMGNNGFLYALPQEFRNKEFVLKVICEYRYVVICSSEIDKCGIPVDFDIALALELQECTQFNGVVDLEWLNNEYSKYLTDEEIMKLLTTLELLTS